MAASLDPDLPGILRLSPEIRQHIYREAGLGPGRYDGEAPVVYDLNGPNGHPETPFRRGSPLGFHGLLVSCRTIHAEAAALLYSSNWFIIRYHQRRSLDSLRALTPHALAHLTNLKIVLNQVSCHAPQKVRCEGRGGCCRLSSACSGEWDPGHQHDFPLDGSDLLAKRMLAEWQTTLSLVCDVHPEEVEAARLVDCHVRLCEGRESAELQRLAQEAALRGRGILSTGSPPSPAPPRPRLLHLPREVRLRILEFTDLITPWKEVSWSRAKRGYWIEEVQCHFGEYMRSCPPQFHPGCQFMRCSRPVHPQPTVGCFCRRWHSAFSSRCSCWAPPAPLFLVCRTLYQDANLVFYGGNRFIVVDGPFTCPLIPWEPPNYPHNTFAVSDFLRDVVPRHCLGHMRYLELVFAPFGYAPESAPQDDYAALLDWRETVDWVKDKINLPGLTLRLMMAGDSYYRPNGGKELTREQGNAILAGYLRILGPLQRLDAASNNGLARFHAEMVWPWRWTDWAVERDRELKDRAERFILGERYRDVAAREPPWSVWQWHSLTKDAYY
ncbi:hypothetical protein C8A01DRAFT_47464 [Parachaetomium inaequale]|uniref:F-box domain-containing protein n=1 Tax=Parachaetomium inaequale TaxID=2588326 RepID=A0AAN6PI58_9PEZI|nr:hypothetical protein C8A01DRAFT_47464 [Parachaetomium inaequale]